ncbi:MAG: hypothetical protein ABFS56_34770, partial [Pseudomonadota bacterium]
MNRYLVRTGIEGLPLGICQSIALLILKGLLCFWSVVGVVYADDSRVEILDGQAVGVICLLVMVILLSIIINLRKRLAFLDELKKESSQLKSWKSSIEEDVLLKLLPDAKGKSPEDLSAAVDKMRSQLVDVTGKGDE